MHDMYNEPSDMRDMCDMYDMRLGQEIHEELHVRHV